MISSTPSQTPSTICSRLLRGADPRDRAELYSRIGLRLTYQPGPETVIAEVATPAIRVFDMCPEGDLNPHAR